MTHTNALTLFVAGTALTQNDMARHNYLTTILLETQAFAVASTLSMLLDFTAGFNVLHILFLFYISINFVVDT
jgi:hypothetical protein